jgi:hypothetical protein
MKVGSFSDRFPKFRVEKILWIGLGSRAFLAPGSLAAWGSLATVNNRSIPIGLSN